MSAFGGDIAGYLYFTGQLQKLLRSMGLLDEDEDED